MKINKKLILTTTLLGILMSAPAMAQHVPVVICHKDRMEITVDNSAVPAHLGHGDKVGLCNVIPDPIPEPDPVIVPNTPIIIVPIQTP